MILALLAASNVVAVLPIDARPGALDPAGVKALEQEIRAVAGENLPCFTLLDPAQAASAPKDPRKALESLNAAAVVFAIAAKVEGSTVMAITGTSASVNM